MGLIAQPVLAASTAGRDSTGALWEATASTDGFRIRRSTDGSTWEQMSYEGRGVSDQTAVQADLVVDEDDNVHAIFTAVGVVQLHSLRLTDATARTYALQTAAIANTSGSDYVYRAKVLAHRVTEGSAADGWIVHTAHVEYSGIVQHYVYRLTVANGLQYLTGTSLTHTFGSSNYNNVALAFEWSHATNGRSRSGPAHLMIVLQGQNSDPSVNVWRATHAPGIPGAWAWSAKTNPLSFIVNGGSSTECLDLLYDGARWVVMLGGTTGGSEQRFGIYTLSFATGEVASNLYFNSASTNANSTQITRALFANGARMSYAGDGSLWVFGQDWDWSQDNVMALRRLPPGASDFDAVVSQIIPAGQPNSFPYVRSIRMRRAATWAGRLDYTYTNYDSGSNQRQAYQFSYLLNQAPNVATALSPINSQRVDRTQPIPCSWQFSDNDSGDTQSGADFRYRVGTGAWTTIANAVTTATSYSIPANTFAAEQVFGWQVLPRDAQGTPAPAWSTEAFGTASDPTPAPTITAPATGGTIPTSSYLVQWASGSQDAYQLRRVADNAGNPNPSTIYFDSGVQEDSTSRSRTVTFETNNRTEHVQVRVRKGGLWSTWASAKATVSYTPPATPVLALAAVKTRPEYLGTDAIDVTITNPAPTGNQPTVVAHDVFVDDGTGEGLRRVAVNLPAGGVWRHTTPVVGRDYQLGRIRVVAIAGNGTTSTASS